LADASQETALEMLISIDSLGDMFAGEEVKTDIMENHPCFANDGNSLLQERHWLRCSRPKYVLEFLIGASGFVYPVAGRSDGYV
jgi:hypothetical protein